MTRPTRRARFALPALIALLAIGSQHAAPGDPVVSQEPMYLQGAVKPAFIMAVDDSGSMQWESLARNQDGELIWGRDCGTCPWGFFEDSGALRDGGQDLQGDYLELFPYPGRGTSRRTVPATTNFGFARSPTYNPAYYDPTASYSPWKKSDGTSWENLDTAAEWQTARVEPRVPASQTFNLTTNVRRNGPTDSDNINTGNNDWDFDYSQGMVIPAGTEFFDDCGNVNSGTTGWVTTVGALTLSGQCDLGVTYFPATYYLTTATSTDGYIGTPLAVTNPVGGPRSTTLYRYEIKPANYPAGGAAYTAAMTNFANWFTYYRTRNLAMVAALTISFDDIDYMRVGYFTINNRVTPTMRDMAVQADRNALYYGAGGTSTALTGGLTALPASGGTPNRFAVAHLGQQFLSPAVNAVQVACQVNAGMLFTDGYSNSGGPTGFTPGDSAMGAPFQDAHPDTLADIAATYYNMSLRSGAAWDNKITVPLGCPGNGSLDCRDDPHMNFYGITLGALGERYGVTPYIDNPVTPANEATAAAFSTPPAWNPRQDDTPRAVDEIWHATINGRGNFINAASPQAITKAMQAILGTVAAPTTESGSRGATGARISDGSNSFTIEPSFKVSGADWTGDVVAKAVKRNGALVPTPLWSAAAKLDARVFSTRKVFFAKQPGTSAAIDKRLFDGTNVTFADLGFGTSAPAVLARNTKYPSATETWMTDYLKGDDTREQPQTAGIFRQRSSPLGDIINSPPLIASPKDNFGYYTRFDASGQKYADYLIAKKTRKTMVYVGANDGMLHAFDGSTTLCGGPFPDPNACVDTGSGDELFAFVPNGVLGKMNRLLDPDYGKGSNPHAYFVDGETNVVDVKNGGSWETVLVGTTGAGGRSVFGLNVSNPTGFNTGHVLWELNNNVAGFANIGNTVGRPLILPLNVGTKAVPNTVWAALFGNGYGGDSRKSSLFIVDIMTGALIREIAPDDGEPGVYNGLGEITAIDTDADGHSDAVYGGDLRGNVWKFNVKGPSASWAVSFGGSPFFRAEVGGVRQPITGGFRISAGPSGGVTVLFGSGSFVFTADKPAGSALQSLYAVWDRKDTDTTPVGGRGNLVGQTITSETTNLFGTTRGISQNPVNYTAKFGWYLDLAYPAATPAGERFVGTPRIQNGKVFFTSYTPNAADECGAGGENFLYVLDLLSGQGALAGLKQLGGTVKACTGSNCGAVALEPPGQKNVAPVMNTSVMVPAPPPVPGVSCVAGTPGCPATPTFQECQVVIYPGAYVLRRPCDRQSWRQVR